MLGRLSKNDQNRLITAMQTIQQPLGSEPEHRAPFLLRTHEPGDMGWIVHHHGLFFADEFGWNEKYRARLPRRTPRRRDRQGTVRLARTPGISG